MSNSGVPIVEDLAGGVGDVVEVIEDAYNDAGDAISDVTSWIDDTVIQPVVDVTKDVLSNELVVTVASIAATATGNAWAVPLIQGASVAAQGGDIRDVLEASAKAYVASQIGAKVGSSVGSSVASSMESQVAGNILGQSAGQATTVAIMGGDPVQAFLMGGAMASVPHIMGQSDYFAGISDKMQDGTASAGEIASYKAAQTLVTSAVTGRDVDENVVAAVAASSYLGGELLKEVDPNNEFTEAESALVMDMVNSSMQAYVTGGNIEEAVMKDIVRYGKEELGTYLKDVKENFTKTNTAYESLTAKATEIETNTEQRTAALERYRGYENEYETELALLTEKQQQAQAAYDDVEAGTMSVADAEAIINDYNDEAALFEARINDYYNPNLETTADEYAQYEEIFADLTEDYNSLMENFESEADQIDEKLEPAYEKLKESFVQGMDPNFNADEYKEVNGLADDIDAYDHWLTEGKEQQLPTNVDSATAIDLINQQLADSERQRIYEEAIDRTGILGKAAVTPDSAKEFFAQLDDVYGNDLSALRDVTGDKVDSFMRVTDAQLEELELQAALDNAWDLNKLKVATAQQLPQEVLDIMDKYDNGGYSIDDLEPELNALGYAIDRSTTDSDSDANITIPLVGSLYGLVRPIGEATSRGSAVSGRVITDPTTGEVTFASSTKTPDYEMWSADTGALETVEGSFQTVDIREEIKKDPFTWLTSLSQAEEDMRAAIQESTGLDDYFFDVSRNAINLAQNTNNNAPVQQAADIFKTDDVDAIQNYNNIISKDATTWGEAYTPTDEDVVNVLGTISSNPDLDSQTAIQQYVDPRYIDIDEVKEAAAQQGYQISDEEALQYTGQFNESETLPTYQGIFDPLATTEEEAREFFSRYRYDPTDEEVQQFISGTVGEEAQRRAIGTYVIPSLEGVYDDISGISGQLTGLEGTVGGLETELDELGLGLGDQLTGLEGTVGGLEAELDELGLGLGDQLTGLEGTVGGLETELDELGLGLGDQLTGLEGTVGGLGDQLTGLEGGVSDIGRGLGDQLTGLEGTVSDIGTGLGDQLTGLEGTVGGLGDQLTGLEGTVGGLEGTVGGLGDQVTGLEGTVGGLGDQLTGLEGTVGGIGDQVGGLEQGLGELGQGLGEGIGGVLGLISGMGKDLRRQTRTNTLLSLLNAGAGGSGQQQEVKSVDPARIGYVYDIGGESIFATPQQERMFVTPYASGGQVDNTTDALLRLLEGK